MKVDIMKLYSMFWTFKKFHDLESSVKEIKTEKRKKQLRTEPSLRCAHVGRVAEKPRFPLIQSFATLILIVFFGLIGTGVAFFTHNYLLIMITKLLMFYLLASILYYLYLLFQAAWQQAYYDSEMSVLTQKHPVIYSETLFDLGFQHCQTHEDKVRQFEEEIGLYELSEAEHTPFWCGHAFCRGQEEEIARIPKLRAEKIYAGNRRVLSWYLRGREAAYE